ncbi:MAG: NAD(P)H-hydrate dehydratase [Phycisphaerales bacterium]|nr:NAD(P)H-hydrate dehydratase [Phycisphaerales bacterium]
MSDASYELPPLPERDPEGHKGTFGTVAVFGGCAHAGGEAGPGRMMIGAPALAAIAALRAGAGLAHIAAPAPVLATILGVATSATGTPLPVDGEGRVVPHLAAAAFDRVASGADCLAVGPGLGSDEGGRALTVRALAQGETPVVLDADGLNHLAGLPDAHLDIVAPTVLTPHPGEFRRLAEATGVGVRASEDAVGAAGDLARRLGCVVVLKGAKTVVSDGHACWVHAGMNPALATGGSGDVLTGVIAGLVAQFHARGIRIPGREQGLPLLACSCWGVRLHAAAGALWAEAHAGRAGLLAQELADLVPAARDRLSP